MAVNLRATATLNTKPFVDGIRSIKAATESLNKSAVKGSTAVTSGVLAEKAAREDSSKAVRQNQQVVTKATGAISNAVGQATTKTDAYTNSLDSVQRTARSVTAEYSKMTPTIARLTDAKENLAKSENRLAREAAQGLAGPAYDDLHERVIRDAKAVGKAQAAIERELNSSLDKQVSARNAGRLAAERKVTTALDTLSKQQATERLNAEKQLNKSLDSLGKQRATERLAVERQLNNALDAERTRQNAARGAANAAAFRQSLASMTAEQAALAQARNRILTAEQQLAKAYTSGKGIAAAETGLIRAEQGYRKLATAQEAVAKGTIPVSSGLAAQRYLYHDLSRQLGGYALGLAALPAAAIAAGTVWEKSFAAVVRTADPAFSEMPTKVQGLRNSLVQMVEALPTSFGAVTEIATLANQMGIASTQTAEFTRAVTMFSATSGVSVDIAATAFGRLTSILGDNSIGFNEMADSILKVGVNSVATEDEIINVATQISSIAAQAGFSAQDMIGFSGALASVRVPPELSRGVVTRVFGTISRAISAGGDDLDKFAKISGMSSREFQKSWGTDQAASTVTKFLNGLKELGPAAESELRSLGITSVRDVPVLLRLATAADSEGVVGGLVAQTLKDAYDSAGENQRQYTIIADTVAAKFKVLGNNIVSFFDAVGSKGMGPIGDVLDGLAGGIRNISRQVRNGEADWLGWVFVISGVASVVALLGSAVSGVMASMKTFAHLGSLMATPFTRARTAASAIGTGMIAANTATGRLGGALKKSGTYMTNLVGGAGNVAALIGIAAIAGVITLNEHLKTAGVKSTKVAENIAKIDFSDSNTNLDRQIDGIFKGLKVSNLGVSGTGDGYLDRLFGTSSAVSSMEEYQSILSNMKFGFGGRMAEAFSSENMYGLKQIGSMFAGTETQLQVRDRDILTIERYGQALGDMVDAGNGSKAISLLKKMNLSATDLNKQLEKSQVVKDYIDQLLDMGGVTPNENNRLKLINGELREITDSVHNFKNLESINTDDLFGGDTEAINELQAAISGTVSAFFDLKSARANAMDSKGNLDFGKFMQNLADNAAIQRQWSTDMGTLARTGSQAFMKYLTEQGPEIADVIRGFVENPEAFANAEEFFRQNAEAASDGYIEGIAAATSRIKEVLGDELGQALVTSLTDSELTTLYTAMEGVGDESAKRVATGLAEGRYNVQQALGMLKLDNALEIDTSLNIDPAKLTLSTFSALAAGSVSTVQLDAQPAPAEGKLLQVLQTAAGQTAFIEVDAETGEAIGDIATVVDSAGNAVGTVKLTADEKEAIATINSAKATADDTVGTMKVQADTTLAEGALSSLNGRVTYSTHVVQIMEERYSRNAIQYGADDGARFVQADGGVVSYYANGGVRENHVAQIAPAGAMRVWAEAETGGEAYIPLAPSKRVRSEAILDTVADRFGYSLVRGNNVSQYANGGTYELQSRSRYDRMRNDRTRSADTQRDLNFTFVNPVEKDWAKDAWEKAQMVGALV